MANSTVASAADTSSEDPTTTGTRTAPRVAPSAASMATATRRGILGAIVAAPVAIPAIAYAAPDREFARVHAAYLAATKAELGYSDEVSEPAATAFFDAVAAIPVVTGRWHDIAGTPQELSSASRSDVAIARAWLRDADESGCTSADFGDACRKIVAGEEHRTAEVVRLRHSTGYDAADRRQSDLSRAQADATRAVVVCPVSTIRDLLIKMEVVGVEDWITDEGIHEHIIADVRRIGGC